MRIAIVDDELEVREMLSQYIARFSQEKGMPMEVTTFSSGDAFLSGYKKIYDIIIFDIDMPGTNGIDTARLLRKIDTRVTIVFVTNIAQYAICGYEVDAVDYIIKPIGYYDFSMKFHRAVGKAAQKQEHFLKVETAEGMKSLRVADIVYAEVLSHYLYFHTITGVVKVRGSMKDLEEELLRFTFARAHKSFVINLQFVEKIQSKEVTVSGKTLPVGRGYRDTLRQEYMRFVRGEEA